MKRYVLLPGAILSHYCHCLFIEEATMILSHQILYCL